jgi:hypothetical protein
MPHVGLERQHIDAGVLLADIDVAAPVDDDVLCLGYEGRWQWSAARSRLVGNPVPNDPRRERIGDVVDLDSGVEVRHEDVILDRCEAALALWLVLVMRAESPAAHEESGRCAGRWFGDREQRDQDRVSFVADIDDAGVIDGIHPAFLERFVVDDHEIAVGQGHGGVHASLTKRQSKWVSTVAILLAHKVGIAMFGPSPSMTRLWWTRGAPLGNLAPD